MLAGQRIANTMAALTLRLTPRTPAELAAQPPAFWSRILAYTEAGIPDGIAMQLVGQRVAAFKRSIKSGK